jgi:hypothetical protein
MKTVNSLSGGKTSSYIAKHYPAGINIFALVRIEADYCKPKDKGLVKYVSEKIGMDFIATAESDKTLVVVRELEQLIGQEIKWVTGKTFEQVIFDKNAIPNQMMRFCTTEMKIRPIFDWWHNELSPQKVDMRIGFRYDEIERGYEKNNEGVLTKKQEKPFKHIIGKHPSGKNKWKETQWRRESFPLIDDRVTHFEIYKWAMSTGIDFPSDSNCVGCFWKKPQQLRMNFDTEPNKMRWFKEMEQKMNRRWKKEMTYQAVEKLGLQLDFNFGTGSGCSAGYCTD